MNKTAQTELHRVFVIDKLPDPVTPASSHLQIFDDYIHGTRLRIRQIRDPYSNTWTRILQQRFPAAEGEGSLKKLAEIFLNDSEYDVLRYFEGREIRKNRYFHEFDGVMVAFDVFLGPLWGLHMARVDFESIDQLRAFEPPPWAVIEVTDDQFFAGENLYGRTFDEISDELAKVRSHRVEFETADE